MAEVRGARSSQRAAVVVFGEQVVVEEVVGVSLVTHIEAVEMFELLQEAGMADAMATATSEKLVTAGFDMPSAWSEVQRSELLAVGVGAGYLNSVVAAFQKRSLAVCGQAFARVMVGSGSSVKSDAEIAAMIQRAKGAPQAPTVSEASGWAPEQVEWLDFLKQTANWLAPMDPQMAGAVRQIEKNFDVVETALQVPRLNIRSLALGAVLVSPQGDSSRGALS